MINVSKLLCGVESASDYLRYSKQDDSGPVVVYNCTRRCNLNCMHCYSSSAKETAGEELGSNEAKNLLVQLAEYSCPVVLFSGGEPMLREDIFELIKEAGRLGIRSVLSTNGTLINSCKAGRLAEAGVGYVGISIDGNRETHDRFRNAEGSFEAALNGLDNCRNEGIKTGLRFTINKTNFAQIPDVFRLAAEVAVRRICFYHLVRSGRAQRLNEYVPRPAQSRQTVNSIIENTIDFAGAHGITEVLTVGNHCDGPYILLKMAQLRSSRLDNAEQLLSVNGGNRSGQKIACISWDGNVHPDQFWHNYSLGNIKQRSFREIWQDEKDPVLKKLRKKKEFNDPVCRWCRWFELCRGNYRFPGEDASAESWANEPCCYLTRSEKQTTTVAEECA